MNLRVNNTNFTGIKKFMPAKKVTAEKTDFLKQNLDKYLGKSYNIVGLANDNGIQPISQIRIIEPGSIQEIDTTEGRKDITAEYGQVLFINSKGRRSLESVGNVAETHLITGEARDALLTAAEYALAKNPGTYDDDDHTTNYYYHINGTEYLPTRKIAGRVNGLKRRDELGGFNDVHKRFSYLE